MLSKKLLALVGLITVVGLLLTACGGGTTPTPAVTQEPATTEEATTPEATTPEPETPAPTNEKTLVVCMGQEPDTLYRWGGDMLAASHILQAIYDGLEGGMDTRTYAYQPVILEKLPSLDDGDAVINKITVQEGDMIIDNDGNPVELAKDMVIRPTGCRAKDCAVTFDGTPVEMDQMVVTFKLKQGITWSDGEPLTADDSVYGFELQADPDTPTTKYTIERTASYEASDDTTAVWTGLPGLIDATYYINFFLPMPRHAWEEAKQYAPKDLLSAEESSRMPIGWGPFVIKEWVQGDHITVERNANYFRASEGLPYVSTIIFRFVKDSNAVVAQLISGECDIATQETSLEDQAELLLKLEEQAVITPLFVTGTAWEHLDFSIDPVETYDRPDFFQDLRVRQAIAHCLNRQEVIDTILYGRSITISSYAPPEHPLYAGDMLTSYEYDIEKGKALLAEVGWTDGDGDGVVEAKGVEGVPDGTVFEVKWQSTTAAFRVQYMQIFQKHLADCGIKVNLENLSASEFFADGPEGPVFGRQYDMGSFTWVTGVEPSCDLYMTELIPGPDNGWSGQNNPAFSNEEYDAACKRALQALPGSEDYVQGHKEAQRLFSENLPVVPLFLRLKIAAYRPEVTGFIMDPTQNSEMWNIEAFDINR